MNGLVGFRVLCRCDKCIPRSQLTTPAKFQESEEYKKYPPKERHKKFFFHFERLRASCHHVDDTEGGIYKLIMAEAPKTSETEYAIENMNSIDRYVCFLNVRHTLPGALKPYGRWAAIEMIAKIGAIAPYFRLLPLVADTIRPWDFKTAYLV